MSDKGAATSSWTSEQRAVATMFVAARFMAAVDETIVLTALPAMARQFQRRAAELDAVVVAYLVAQAVAIPASGWLGDRVGTKRTFVVALAAFAAASALCGFAASVSEVVIVRIAQGVAAALLVPVSTTMHDRAFPPEQRGRAAQATIVPAIIAPALGPILGGVLVDRLSWRWVFWVNVPIGAAALAFALVTIRERRSAAAGRVDWAGLALSGGGLGLLFYGVSDGLSAGWSSPIVSTSLGVGVSSLAALVRLELRRASPLLDVRLLGERLFRATNTASLFANASFIGVLFVMPLYLQSGRGFSALDAGLTTFPEALGGALCSQAVGRLYGMIGPRRLIAAAAAWLALAALAMTVLDDGSSIWLIRGLMFAAGVGIVAVLVPVQTAAFTKIGDTDTAQASTLLTSSCKPPAPSVWPSSTPSCSVGSRRATPPSPAGWSRPCHPRSSPQQFWASSPASPVSPSATPTPPPPEARPRPPNMQE